MTIKMKMRSIFNSGNTRLRAAIKNIMMGNYLPVLTKAAPLNHELNRSTRKGIAFTNCNVFDGTHSELKPEMTVLIEKDNIIDMGHQKNIQIPEFFYRVDAEGRTLMPGLIDNHVHMCSPFTYEVNFPAIRQMQFQVALNNLRMVSSGVTTVRDMGGPQGIIREFSTLSDQHLISGPRYLNCYTLISPIKGKKLGYPSQVKPLNPFEAWLLEGQVATRPLTIRELREVCHQLKDAGVMHLKTTYQPQPFSRKKYPTSDEFPVFDDEWMKTIFIIAKESDLPVAIHAPYGDGAEKCVDLAIEVGAKIRLQHMIFDMELKPSLVQKMRDYNFYIIPTIMVYGDAFCMTDFISWLEKDSMGYMMPEAKKQSIKGMLDLIDREPYSGQMVMEHDTAYFRDCFEMVRQNTLKAHEGGIIGFGTDLGGTPSGFFGRIITEITHYIECGIPAFEILKYMTSVNAEISDLDDCGLIKPGKRADLIMVDGNPLENLSVLNDISTVMKGGIFLKYQGIDLGSFPNLS